MEIRAWLTYSPGPPGGPQISTYEHLHIQAWLVCSEGQPDHYLNWISQDDKRLLATLGITSKP